MLVQKSIGATRGKFDEYCAERPLVSSYAPARMPSRTPEPVQRAYGRRTGVYMTLVGLTDLVLSELIFRLIRKKSSGPLITFKSSSSKYKVFPWSIAMDFIFEFAKNG